MLIECRCPSHTIMNYFCLYSELGKHERNMQNNVIVFCQSVFSRKFKNLKFQITLIKSGWNELMIIGAAYRSLSLNEEGILMGQGKVITMEDAHRAGLGEIFDRVLVELVGKMEEMKMVSLYILYLVKIWGKWKIFN